MPPCSTHVHHRPTFPIQFLPDPRISLVNILPNHCCLTPVIHREQKQKTHSRLSPSSSGASFPWLEWLTSTPAVTLMAWAQLSPFFSVSGSTLTTVVSYVAKNGWKNCSWQEMSQRNSGKEEKFDEHNPIHMLQTVLLSLLLAHGQAQTKSVSLSISQE